MSRLLLIARREYLSYLRTAGFWISLLIVPAVVGFISLGGTRALSAMTPPPTLAIVDLSQGARFRAAAEAALAGPPPLAVLADAPALPAGADPSQAAKALRPRLARGGGLDLAAVASGAPEHLRLDVWGGGGDEAVVEALQASAAAIMRQARLEAQGAPPGLVQALRAAAPEVRRHLPSPDEGTAAAASRQDQTPVLMAMYLSLVLLVSLMTAAGILLNSTIEEKAGRILEVLMSSASTADILGGKILGVAGLTGTVLLAWVGFGCLALLHAAPGELATLLTALARHGLGIYFGLYFLAGYLMYAALFAAIGAFCETSREAQTLVGPLMILLSVPIIFLTTAVQRPDAPVVVALSFVPLFAPFLMTARIAAGLAASQAVGGLALLGGTAAAVLWLCSRAFRAGALSSGRLELRQLLGRR